MKKLLNSKKNDKNVCAENCEIRAIYDFFRRKFWFYPPPQHYLTLTHIRLQFGLNCCVGRGCRATELSYLGGGCRFFCDFSTDYTDFSTDYMERKRAMERGRLKSPRITRI